MPENRFYINHTLSSKKTIELEENEFKHLMVMRPRIQQVIELVDGEGHLAQAEIVSLGKHSASLKISWIDRAPPPRFELICAQAMPRFNRLDIILEKGTELGMTELWLFPGEASEKMTLSPTQQNRIDHVMIAALKQCGRLYLPKIQFLPPILEWNHMPFSLYFGDVRKEAPSLLNIWQSNPPSQGAIFVIGPEKGLTPEEIIHLENMGAQGVTLHPHILRTDTAPLAALSLMSHFLLSYPPMI